MAGAIPAIFSEAETPRPASSSAAHLFLSSGISRPQRQSPAGIPRSLNTSSFCSTRYFRSVLRVRRLNAILRGRGPSNPARIRAPERRVRSRVLPLAWKSSTQS
ncbi:MAG: hypothetical protein A2902_01890 [Elusimicrobia bacterium RIFCSPLOWO2_01_FULL_64_13]|nr:MAG: hypothetical protein A2902_01890 [Elusimicrobia bacterium RIFCSPLOWO2_01_FULL_64_13]